MYLKRFSLYLVIVGILFASCSGALSSAMGKRAEKLAIEIPTDGTQFPMDFSKEKSIIYVINNPTGLENQWSLIKGFKKVFDKFYDGNYEYINQEDLKSISKKSGSVKAYVLGVRQASQGSLTKSTGFRDASQYKCTFKDIANDKTYITSITSDYGTITAAYLKKLGSLK